MFSFLYPVLGECKKKMWWHPKTFSETSRSACLTLRYEDTIHMLWNDKDFVIDPDRPKDWEVKNAETKVKMLLMLWSPKLHDVGKVTYSQNAPGETVNHFNGRSYMVTENVFHLTGNVEFSSLRASSDTMDLVCKRLDTMDLGCTRLKDINKN